MARKPSPKYQARAEALARAIDIAARHIAHRPAHERESELAFGAQIKADALDPAPGFSSLKSLAYLENAFLTPWNEDAGEHVEAFWAEAREAGLPFERTDVIGDILRRGRIRNDIELEHVTDGIVVLQQLGIINAEQRAQLSQMIAAYEAKSS